jgi:Fe-S cluster biogenesis protein NfuA
MRQVLSRQQLYARATSLGCGPRRERKQTVGDVRGALRREEPSRRLARRADVVRVQARRLITYGAIKNEGSYTLELTEDNVETVLDEVRPYLMADGGNVELVEIDGLTVRLKLMGACGSCPSSMTTMRMGIQRKLMEKIPVSATATKPKPKLFLSISFLFCF